MKRFAIALLTSLTACTTTGVHQSALLPGSEYVAMGSSYAAGAGIGPLAPQSPKRCGRTLNNYAHLISQALRLKLIDVSCGGATTQNVLSAWLDLPPQIDALTPETRLVTITVGGNDLNYVRNLMVATCGRVPGMIPSSGRSCPQTTWPSAADFDTLAAQLHQIAKEVRLRSPKATLVFVDYLRVLPPSGGCASIPIDERQSAAARTAFQGMADVTRKVAKAEGAVLLAAGDMSKGHDACSKEPWAAGYPGAPASWHPNAAGHAAIANALLQRLRSVGEN